MVEGELPESGRTTARAEKTRCALIGKQAQEGNGSEGAEWSAERVKETPMGQARFVLAGTVAGQPLRLLTRT